MRFTKTQKTKRFTVREFGLFFIGILLSFSLAACNGQSLFATPTVSSSATPTATPTITPMPTFTPSPLADTTLPEGWRLDEYSTYDLNNRYGFPGFLHVLAEKYSFDKNSKYWSGYTFGLDPFLVNGHLIEVTNNVPDEGDWEIIVESDGEVVYQKVCEREKETFWWNVIAFWTYDSHWVVEHLCEGRYDVILDGQSLNEVNGYIDSFSAYLVSEKLFFFFYRGEQTGFYYDGHEYLLNYDEILYHHCCFAAEANPIFYDNKLFFYGEPW
jgi:hypothetical protein